MKNTKAIQVIFALVLTSVICAETVAIGQSEARVLVGPNIMVTAERARDGKQYELHVAANPRNSRSLLAAGIVRPAVPSLQDQEPRAYYSTDGGNTWITEIFQEASTERLGDPQVGYGVTGTGYFVAMASEPEEGGSLLFYRSLDGGRHWKEPSILPALDHPMLTVDHTDSKYRGTVYIAGLNEIHSKEKFGKAGDAHIGVYCSRDDGRSWTMADVANNHHMPDHRVNSAQSPLVFSDGSVLVPFKSFSVRENDHYWVVSSNNGGREFSAPQTLKTRNGDEILGQAEPVFAIDSSRGNFRDRLYIAWTDQDYEGGSNYPGNNKVLLSSSSDRGKSWSTPVIVSEAKSGFQFMPTIAVNKDGVLAVAWYDSRDTPGNHIGILVNQYLAVSLDGGGSFSSASRVSSESTDRTSLGKNVMGVVGQGSDFTFVNGLEQYRDYSGMVAAGDGSFHPVWLDGRIGSQQIWTAKVSVTSKRNAAPAQSELIELNVTEKLEGLLDPLLSYPPFGTADVPIRLRNKSDRPVCGPLKVEVASLHGGYDPVAKRFFESDTLMNASNGKPGVGATMDYSKALGDFPCLEPGDVTEAVIWRFRLPTASREFPRFNFKVTGRISR